MKSDCHLSRDSSREDGGIERAKIFPPVHGTLIDQANTRTDEANTLTRQANMWKVKEQSQGDGIHPSENRE